MKSPFFNEFASMLVEHSFRDTDRFGYVWSQKTPYVAPEPDHAAHIARAEEKRLRKAAKLSRSTHPTGGGNHGE